MQLDSDIKHEHPLEAFADKTSDNSMTGTRLDSENKPVISYKNIALTRFTNSL